MLALALGQRKACALTSVGGSSSPLLSKPGAQAAWLVVGSVAAHRCYCRGTDLLLPLPLPLGLARLASDHHCYLEAAAEGLLCASSS